MKSRIFMGVLLIGAGCLFLLNNIFQLNLGDLIHTYWPVIFIAIGIVQLINRPQSITGSLIFIGVGGLLLADRIIPGFEFWSAAIPLLLIVLGVSVILRDKNQVHTKAQINLKFGSSQHSVLNDEVVNVSALFSGSSHRINSKNFRGGTVKAMFGGVELDLRDAKMASTEATLDVDVAFGGVEIRVPVTWEVRLAGNPMFGGIENNTIVVSDITQEHYVLNLRTSVALGGLEIHN